MSLLDKQEVQDICEHTALCARKWSGCICKRASEYKTLSHYIGLLKKEEEERRSMITQALVPYAPLCGRSIQCFEQHDTYLGGRCQAQP